MGLKEAFFCLVIYVFFYIKTCEIALSNYLIEFPSQSTRLRPGRFLDIRRSLVSLSLVLGRGDYPKPRSALLKFQLLICRCLLAGLPLFLLWLLIALDLN